MITVGDVTWTTELDPQSAAALSTRHVAVELQEHESSQGGWPTLKLIGGTRDDVRAWLLTNWDNDEETVDHVLEGATPTPDVRILTQ
jgi:hypothetical protein